MPAVLQSLHKITLLLLIYFAVTLGNSRRISARRHARFELHRQFLRKPTAKPSIIVKFSMANVSRITYISYAIGPQLGQTIQVDLITRNHSSNA
ncbi:hypothetical protein LIPSTDRAFT_323757 [Lipomyces starkeyi NRRL Y-11557]|uniref:Uncharacterized protein n=1 Tax=Lipomyces starkeyi NRRL Y-11557 TaxID=675824 RepID=A0A1E3Q1A6_LIPST|nr:hypothetical protein LIPSTDRAFT_323757 [Lipomyces starkeyi NRRL Y-11557]